MTNEAREKSEQVEALARRVFEAEGAQAAQHAAAAMAAAATFDDDYHRASMAQWPVRALAERGLHAEARRHLETARDQARRAQPNSARAYALWGLLQAAWPLGTETRESIVRELAELAQHDSHWRVLLCLQDSLEFLRAESADFVRGVIDGVSHEKTRRRLERDHAAGVHSAPRDYF